MKNKFYVITVWYSVFTMVLCTLPDKLRAQATYQEVIGGASDDRGRTVRQTSDDGFIIVGSTYSFGGGGQDVYLVKTNSNGTVLWSKTFGGTQEDDGRGVCQTSDGGYVIIGSTNSFGAGLSDVYLLKTDATGDLLWSTTIGGAGEDYGFIVEETSDGGLILVGHTDSYGGGGNDAYLVKTDADGVVTWAKTFGNAGDDRGFSVVQTHDGGYALAGYTTSYGAGGADVYLVKTNSSGDAQWTKTYGGLYDDQAFSLAQCNDNGYILTGFANKDNNAGINNDVYLLKTDVDGVLTWSRTFGGTQDDQGNVVRQTSDGGYVVFGFESSIGFGSYDALLLKTDAAGNAVFTKVYGGTDDDLAISGHYLADNTFVMAGFSASNGAGSFDVFMIKTDSEGSIHQCPVQTISFPTVANSAEGSGFVQGNGYSVTSPLTQAYNPADQLFQMCPPCSDLAVVHHDTYLAPGPATLSVENNGGIYNWYDQAVGGNLVFTGTVLITSVISETVEYYVEHIVPGTITCGRVPVRAIPRQDFFIPNLITPNDDGKNDSFEITGLPDHSTLRIYNRWGKRIFEAESYENSWAGNDVSDGIYYYDLLLEDGKTYKGWLHLLR